METFDGLIRVSQLPVIEGVEVLQAVKADWERRAEEMEALAPTEENKQRIKSLRANERKQRDEIWSRCKAVIDAASEPAKIFKAAFDECVGEPFKRLDEAAKVKIQSIEGAQKAGSLQQCEDYFAELCAVHGIDFISWDDFVRIESFKISMTEAQKKAPSKHFDEISRFITDVSQDLESITTMDDGAAILAEYKRNGLDLAAAIKTFHDRERAREEEEAAIAEMAERQKREAEAVARVEAAVPMVVDPPKIVEQPAAITEQPKDDRKDEITITFRVTGTREQLVAVREFMRKEGIRYE